jgi:hypothetical protein
VSSGVFLCAEDGPHLSGPCPPPAGAGSAASSGNPRAVIGTAGYSGSA